MEVMAIPTIDIPKLLFPVLAESAMTPTQLVMLALALGGITIVMLSTYRRSRRSRQTHSEPIRERYERLDRQTTVSKDVEKAMLELDRLARQILGRIDTRFAKLETVIRDADERIAALSRLVSIPKGRPSVDVTLAPQAPDEVAATTGAPESAQRHDAVYRMADGGLSSLDIARETGKNKGEIELILALRKTRQAGRPAETSVS